MADLTACMGGFCHLRDKCLHHIRPVTRRDPAERLCDRGREQTMFFKPSPMFALPSQLPAVTEADRGVRHG